MHKCICFAIGSFLVFSAVGCVTSRDSSETSPVSFAVEIESTPAHCNALSEDPCPFSMEPVTFHANIVARNQHGMVDTTYNSTVLLSLIPSGIFPSGLENVHTLPNGRRAVAVPMTDGRAMNVPITFRSAFGSVQMFVEDMGYQPLQISNECLTSGSGCPACWGHEDLPKGCFSENDDNPSPGQGGAGVSKNLYFKNPTISQVQFVENVPGAIETSPLEGFRVTIDADSPGAINDLSDCIDSFGNIRELLVVTSVSTDGFFITDVCTNGGPVHAPDTWRNFGSIFAFNFHAPEDLVPGDCITWVQGSVYEFYGFTELKNPNWSSPVCLEGSPGCQPACIDYLPEPFVLDNATLSDNYAMEMLESSLVSLENAVIGYTQSCDFTGNGQIDNPDERACKRACEDSYDCWVLEDYKDYFQFTAHVGNAKISVVLQGVVPFNPVEHQGESITYVAGLVKHLAFARPPWQMYPRNKDDFLF